MRYTLSYFIISNNLNFELCCKKQIGKKIQADRNIDTNKHFPLEDHNK